MAFARNRGGGVVRAVPVAKLSPKRKSYTSNQANREESRGRITCSVTARTSVGSDTFRSSSVRACIPYGSERWFSIHTYVLFRNQMCSTAHVAEPPLGYLPHHPHKGMHVLFPLTLRYLVFAPRCKTFCAPPGPFPQGGRLCGSPGTREGPWFIHCCG